MSYTREQVYSWFETYDKPTQQQFLNLFLSVFFPGQDKLEIDHINSLQTALDQLGASISEKINRTEISNLGNGNRLMTAAEAEKLNGLAGGAEIPSALGTAAFADIGLSPGNAVGVNGDGHIDNRLIESIPSGNPWFSQEDSLVNFINNDLANAQLHGWLGVKGDEVILNSMDVNDSQPVYRLLANNPAIAGFYAKVGVVNLDWTSIRGKPLVLTYFTEDNEHLKHRAKKVAYENAICSELNFTDDSPTTEFDLAWRTNTLWEVSVMEYFNLNFINIPVSGVFFAELIIKHYDDVDRKCDVTGVKMLQSDIDDYVNTSKELVLPSIPDPNVADTFLDTRLQISYDGNEMNLYVVGNLVKV